MLEAVHFQHRINLEYSFYPTSYKRREFKYQRLSDFHKNGNDKASCELFKEGGGLLFYGRLTHVVPPVLSKIFTFCELHAVSSLTDYIV